MSDTEMEMDEQMLEMAALYVMGELQPEPCARFEAEMLGSAELQELVSTLQDDFASLALAAPMVKPPAGLKPRLMAQFRGENEPSKIVRGSFLPRIIPWALAAALAVMAGTLYLKQEKLEKKITVLENRDEMSQMRVAVLQSQVEAFAGGSAVVVWNEKEQRGTVRLEKLPVQPEKDYQLWMLDAAGGKPVNAGLIPVINDGKQGVEFHPEQQVSKGSKFAISVEEKGGAVQPAGQIIFVGE